MTTAASYTFTGLANRTLIANFAIKPLAVTNLEFSANTVSVSFNRPIDASVLNLASFTLLGSTSGLTSGSLLLGPLTNKVTFIATAGPFAPGTYTLTLASTGFEDMQGNFLNSSSNGVAGSPYTNQFTILSSAARTIALPSFCRGPGQWVNVPATDSSIPIAIGEGSNVVSVSLILNYDTNLLNITGVSLDKSAPAGWRLTNSFSPMGTLSITAVGATPLNSGSVTFARLQARVPWCAGYGSMDMLTINSAQLNGGTIPATGESAAQLVAYLGDVDGNRAYTTNDAALVAQFAVGLIDHFPAYPLADVILASDISSDGKVTVYDAALIAQKAIGHTVVSMPDLPLVNVEIQKSANQVTLSWPQCVGNYVLEISPTLGAAANWNVVTNNPVLVGDQITVNVNATTQGQFFRIIPQ